MLLYKNYYYLLRCVDELSNKLKNKKIFSAFSQEKEQLYFHIPIDNFPYYHLVFSTDPKHSLIYHKHTYHKAKKNVAEFFTKYLPDKIVEFSIAYNDRIVKIALEDSTLYFLIRGNDSNFILVDKNKSIDFFKKIKDIEKIEETKQEVLSKKYISSIDDYILDISNTDIGNISKKLPSLGKDVLLELETRNYSLPEITILLNEIYNSPIAVFHSQEHKETIFIPSTFKMIHLPDNANTFNNYLDAASHYLALLNKTSNYNLLLEAIQKHVKKELEKVSNKLNNLKAKIEAGSKENEYNFYGNLLLTNLNKLSKGMSEIELDDYRFNKKIKIKLDPKLLPAENAQSFFEKAKSEKINYSKSVELYNSALRSYEKLTEYSNILNSNPSIDKLEELKLMLNINFPSTNTKENKKDGTKLFLENKFRHFVIDGAYHLFVGKDSKSNDVLTTRFAKQNDYWFHARGYTGSHVVLRVDNPKSGIPKSVIKNAASVAAFYSKAKTSSLVPVSYTLKKFVRKNKKLEVGQVIIEREEVILAKPEIPPNCIIVTDN
ncbi:NFACT RNA binding domain-containing protein [Melioribacteraceae bacterium 4301-Me]|uniref:NFACT RNA binding domain-containing protein n=1 Tax=Pyranulibacter aquaticus TaxID=3163344 RepID=UPI00359A2CCF